MFEYGPGSLSNIGTLHPILRDFLLWAIQYTPYDYSIIEGWRSEEKQTEYLNNDPPLTHLAWPNSNHNFTDIHGEPSSKAFHFLPYPSRDNRKLDYDVWEDTKRFARIAGILHGLAGVYFYKQLQFQGLTWGGDWNNDSFCHDQKLHDLAHMELLLRKDGTVG